MSSPALKIAILGAGIGGPAFALAMALSSASHKIHIYERLSSTSTIGFAFRITPNSERCLQAIGIDVLAGGAVAANATRMFDERGGTIMDFAEDRTKVAAGSAGVSVFASRPQLHKQLVDACVAHGVGITYGVSVAVDIDSSSLDFESGEKEEFDLIVAADGVHSSTRSLIVDAKQYPLTDSTGHSAFRLMVEMEKVRNDSLMKELVDENARMFAWRGEDKRILVYPVDGERWLNITCTHPAELSNKETSQGKEDDDLGYNHKVSLEKILSIYDTFEPRAKRIFELASADGFRAWKLQDMDEIPHWSENRTVLLGDAAHPVSPFGFSGASMAIEDALTLSTVLKGVERDQIKERLSLYEGIRKPRVAVVREKSRLIGKGAENKQFMGEYMGFLKNFDVVAEAEKELVKWKEEAKGI